MGILYLFLAYQSFAQSYQVKDFDPSSGWLTCVVDLDDELACSGFNAGRTLLDGTSNSHATFRKVPLKKKIIDVATGFDQICIVDYSKETFCWGNNRFGLLGIGESGGAFYLPAKVNLKNVKDIEAGLFNICAITFSDELYCWGLNTSTQIDDSSDFLILSPRLVASGISTVALLDNHICYLNTLGEVFCSGENSFGQVGNGTNENPQGFVKVNLPIVATSVSIGSSYSCASGEGKVYCWGYNGDGQLGNGTFNTSNQPVEVLNISNAVKVTTGQGVSCALTDTSEVFCWGWGSKGRTGLGGQFGQTASLLI